jgi:hypothetical protein
MNQPQHAEKHPMYPHLTTSGNLPWNKRLALRDMVARYEHLHANGMPKTFAELAKAIGWKDPEDVRHAMCNFGWSIAVTRIETMMGGRGPHGSEYADSIKTRIRRKQPKFNPMGEDEGRDDEPV